METSDIVKTETGASVNGTGVDPESYVSMNMWGLTPEYIPVLEQGVVELFENTQPLNPLKAEYLLPIFIGELLQEKKVSVEVLETANKWFGVTYKEDKNSVVSSFQKLLDEGV